MGLRAPAWGLKKLGGETLIVLSKVGLSTTLLLSFKVPYYRSHSRELTIISLPLCLFLKLMKIRGSALVLPVIQILVCWCSSPFYRARREAFQYGRREMSLVMKRFKPAVLRLGVCGFEFKSSVVRIISCPGQEYLRMEKQVVTAPSHIGPPHSIIHPSNDSARRSSR